MRMSKVSKPEVYLTGAKIFRKTTFYPNLFIKDVQINLESRRRTHQHIVVLWNVHT